MKTPKRFSPLVAALVLAAFAAALPGCGKPEVKVTKEHPGQAITVVVTYDPDTKKAAILDPDPEKRIFLRKNKDWAVWYSAAGPVSVSFTKESPFDEPPKYDKERKILKSRPPKAGIPGGTGFDYTAELELSDGSRVRIDPRVEVID